MKISLALAGAAMLVGSLAACGGDDGGSDEGKGGGGDYCAQAKKAAKTFESGSAMSGAKIDEAFATFHSLADDAPDEVKDDWKLLDSAITTVEKGFKDAGLKLEDMNELQSGKIPKGVDVAKLRAVAQDFQKLATPEFTEASQAIEKHAKSECKVSFNLS